MKNKNRYNAILSSIYKNIEYYNQMIILSTNSYERSFYESLLYNERLRLNCWKSHCYQDRNNEKKQLDEGPQPDQRVFTIEELAQYDGSNEKPAYVAVNGIVYDVSLEATWGGGTHFSLYAGKDLTPQFTGCHGGNLEVLRNLPKVGILEE